MGSTSSTGTLSALSNFDADLRLRVGSSDQGKAIRDVRLDGNLVDGALRFNDASIAVSLGLKFEGQELGGLERTPVMNRLATGRFDRIIRLLGIKSFKQPRRLGECGLSQVQTLHLSVLFLIQP